MHYQSIPTFVFHHKTRRRPSSLHLLRNDCCDSCEQARRPPYSFLRHGRKYLVHSSSAKRIRPVAAANHTPPCKSTFSPHLPPQQPPQPSPKPQRSILSCTSSSLSSSTSSSSTSLPQVHQEKMPGSNYPLPSSPPFCFSPSSSSSSSSFPYSSSSSRRVVLLASATSALLLLPLLPECIPLVPCHCPSASARLLHSKRSDAPCYLTIRNRRPRPVDARWVNYDGDEESYTTIPPGHAWTVETYETHPWRFRDARTGDLLCEYIAQRGDRLLQLYDDPAGLLDSTPGSSSSNTIIGSSGAGGGVGNNGDLEDGGDWRRRQRRHRRRQPAQYDTEPPPDVPGHLGQISTASGAPDDVNPYNQSLSHSLFQKPPEQHQQQLQPPAVSERPGLAGGFDGLGNPAEQYTSASLLSVAVLPQESQAVVVLGLTDFVHPLSLLVGVSEARNIVNAAGAARGRRPTLLATWLQTLQALGGTLERVVITRQVGGIFYARIVLSQPYWGFAPLNPRPADAAAHAAHPPPSGGHGHARHGGQGHGEAQGDGEGDGEGFSVSIDARPSDALALALEAGAEVFVSRPVAELVQQQYLGLEKDRAEKPLPLPPQQMSTEGEGDGKGEEEETAEAWGRRFLAAEGGLLSAPLA